MARGHLPGRRPMAFGVGAAAAPGHGTPGSAARTRRICVNSREWRVNPRISSRITGELRLALTTARMLSLRAHLPPTPEPLRVLGRAPRPRTFALFRRMREPA